MFSNIKKAIIKATQDAKDAGASAVEYGLMVAAIAAVIVGLVFALGGVIENAFNKTGSQICTSSGQTTSNTADCGKFTAPTT